MLKIGAVACCLLLAVLSPLAVAQGPQPFLAPSAIPPEELPAPGPTLAPQTEMLGPPPVVEIPPDVIFPDEVPEPPPKLWEGSFKIGINGTEGNSDTFNYTVGANGKRKTAGNELTLSLIYNKNKSNGVNTANRLFTEGRKEWLFDQSPWTLYVHGSLEYDEFKAFDVRLTGDAGVGYNFIKSDITTLVGRLGPGFSQEIGGPDDRLVPEAALGMEFEHKLSARQKVMLSGTYFPALDDYQDFRLTTKASWEFLIDPEWNLSLQFMVSDRYDSTPNGARPNDLDYAMVLLWSF